MLFPNLAAHPRDVSVGPVQAPRISGPPDLSRGEGSATSALAGHLRWELPRSTDNFVKEGRESWATPQGERVVTDAGSIEDAPDPAPAEGGTRLGAVRPRIVTHSLPNEVRYPLALYDGPAYGGVGPPAEGQEGGEQGVPLRVRDGTGALRQDLRGSEVGTPTRF